jgi:hypothetical protein
MELQLEGYPLEIFYVLAVLGVLLVLYRPQWAFLLIVFCLALRHHLMAVFTRTTLLGEYVNLNDLLLWIGVLALVRMALKGHKIWIPKILVAIIGILLLGSFQSLFKYGFHYLVMQAIWSTLIFPIMFAIAVNMVRNENDARNFVWALFLGSVGAALQHIFFVNISLEQSEYLVSLYGITAIRSVAFMYSGGIFLVISTFFVNMKKIFQRYSIFIIWIIGISIIVMSYLLSFSRTVWVGAFMSSLSLLIILYQKNKKIFVKFCYTLLLIGFSFLLFRAANFFLAADVEVTQLISERTEFVRFEDTFEEAYGSRETGMRNEVSWWLNGSILWGVGSSYDPSLIKPAFGDMDLGALNHVAFSAYLAHFGLIGLFIYGLLLPFLSFKAGKQYYLGHQDNYGGVIALMAMALAFYDFFTLPSNNLYLVNTVHVSGLIYGAMWGLSRSLEVSPAHVAPINVKIYKPQLVWLPGPLKQ